MEHIWTGYGVMCSKGTGIILVLLQQCHSWMNVFLLGIPCLYTIKFACHPVNFLPPAHSPCTRWASCLVALSTWPPHHLLYVSEACVLVHLIWYSYVEEMSMDQSVPCGWCRVVLVVYTTCSLVYCSWCVLFQSVVLVTIKFLLSVQFATKFLSSWTGLLDFCINVTIRTINHQWIWMNESILLWCCVRMASSLFPCSLAILRTQGMALWWSSESDQLCIMMVCFHFYSRQLKVQGAKHTGWKYW